jgi:hypothetical protein
MTDHGPTVAEETQQEEPTPSLGPPVPIVSNFPLRTQELPGVVTAIRTVLVPADGSIVNITNSDLRRKYITLIPIGQPVKVSLLQNFQGASSDAATIPSNVPITFHATMMLYAVTGTTDTAVPVSVFDIDYTE